MPVKGKGEGYVFFNKQRKKWNAQYMEYDVKTGTSKPKTKSFNSEEDAKKYLASVMYQKENPVYIEHNGIPLCQLMRTNLQLKLDTNCISPSQFTRVTDTINKLSKFPVVNKNIDEITSDEIQAYLNSIKHLSNSSISKEYQQFNQAFTAAVNKGYLTRNPMTDVIKPKSLKEDKDVRALTVEEQQVFTDYLLSKTVKECKYKNTFLIQMYMGLRIGEALALSTHDFNLKTKMLYVRRTLTIDEDKHLSMGKKTKTYSGKRNLPIPDFLIPYILEQMKIADKQKNNEEKLLFKPPYSKYIKPRRANEALKAIFSTWEIYDITTHCLRHTYGTRCIEARYVTCCRTKVNGS